MFMTRTAVSLVKTGHLNLSVRWLSLSPVVQLEYAKPVPEVDKWKSSIDAWQKRIDEKAKIIKKRDPANDAKVVEAKEPVKSEAEERFAPYRFVYPEFLPDPSLKHRNRIREKLERVDMLKRRSNLDIPEFYPGSILKVTVSDKYAVGKFSSFVGICLFRGGTGLRAHFCLRNHIDKQGIEILYEMYNPTIQTITVLRLEKRLDDNILYLRDTDPIHSTFPLDMQEEIKPAVVPVNPIKVQLNKLPWSRHWQNYNLQGVLPGFFDGMHKRDNRYLETLQSHRGDAVIKYDLMKTYRETIPAEEQSEIYGEISSELSKLTHTLKKQKRKRTFVKPEKVA